ncbi:peroxidase 60-like [Humulus lupulus]|uniref:peroxidase 60-like n=1 Tax=Humulus lupulus TaxID=3486 RepID=UPI002B410548|nr:peroxidase 60-like [Humulus lupulus]
MATIVGIFVLGMSGQCYAGSLQSGYYSRKCSSITSTGFWPFLKFQTTDVNVEATVKAAMKAAFDKDPTIAPALLRMQFHDCFVKGCDASILIDTNRDGSLTEKKAGPNLSVRGYNVIDSIKQTLEDYCAGVVSCADIIAMATRDAVNFDGKVQYVVETGRLDGKESKLTNVNLPPPTISVSNSISAFSQKGLDTADMVYLLGGHTVGIAHCSLFQDRVYNFNGSGKPDPTMNSTLVNALKSKCPQPSTVDNIVPLDQTPKSALVVDKAFYNQLLMSNGILKIDQELAIDQHTKNIVSQLAFGNDFAQKFGQAMVKLGRVEVITDTSKGEIRKSCRSINRSIKLF